MRNGSVRIARRARRRSPPAGLSRAQRDAAASPTVGGESALDIPAVKSTIMLAQLRPAVILLSNQPLDLLRPRHLEVLERHDESARTAATMLEDWITVARVPGDGAERPHPLAGLAVGNAGAALDPMRRPPLV